MDFFSAEQILSSGLSAERIRMNTIASNLANSQTTRSADGGPYKRMDPVFHSRSISEMSPRFGDRLAQEVMGVEVSEIRKDPRAPKLIYDPSHPDATADGYVAMPNINSVEEMVNMITASRTYEAGVKAFSMLHSMANRAIGIGK